jgi:inner membrane protein
LDNLTHSLFGLTLARTPLGRAGRGATVALLLASNAPDIDIVATAGGAVKYLEWHRGPTHGPLGVVALGLVSAALAVLVRRAWHARRSPESDAAGADASFMMLWTVAIIGVICHVLMDLPTSYGTRPFSPFDWHWYAVDWMPIVDVYLLAILAAGLWYGNRGAGARQRNAAIVLALMAVNYGLRGAAHHVALGRAAETLGPLVGPSCPAASAQGWIDRWPRPPIPSDDPRGDSAPPGCLVEVAALPGFSSPFSWRLIAQLSNGYELHDLDLLAMPAAAARNRSTAPRLSTRIPNQWTPAVFRAARSPFAQTFLGFSRFPAARSLVDTSGAATVRWSDMRFVASPIGERRPLNSNLFSVRVRLDPAGQVVEAKFGP